MTTAPRTNEVLHETANDFRALGDAVKHDLNDLRQEARVRIDTYTQKVKEDANQNLGQLREYTVQNPMRALGYAALGGMFFGLFLRR
ncbi:ElaB/YqjD/DUF883 family membrane-anchored ribosome-binding protein [Prosthecobacter fusiformis]|uniref:ElaB/YqjD/DUF883 family membrane-anchored ribosome-binding protein n=1 Tax=Prosthecobacter fusiformis TaxID=48464 RepID=A0A4R7RPJ3_9BACT|nr:hypothetical protein [Prosthecobacter fusiformis]TDU66566.1 ElaB/YqjD/DUF883 family membrane-anchored ribosome-binding protein [Prosthecobacter fusiformis]